MSLANSSPPPIKPRLTSRFIAFEGLDGSGKTTLSQALAAELDRREIATRLTREPGGTPLAEDIRGLLLRTESEAPVSTTELLLYAASRAQHVARVIRPALDEGRWVLCDRFTASSVAFQAYARGLSRVNTDWLNAFAIQGTKPDLNILLDLPVTESFRRQASRKKDRMENEAVEFHENVRRGYLEQSTETPAAWLVLDARSTPDILIEQVLANFRSRAWLE